MQYAKNRQLVLIAACCVINVHAHMILDTRCFNIEKLGRAWVRGYLLGMHSVLCFNLIKPLMNNTIHDYNIVRTLCIVHFSAVHVLPVAAD